MRLSRRLCAAPKHSLPILIQILTAFHVYYFIDRAAHALIPAVFILGTFLTALSTEGYLYGILSALLENENGLTKEQQVKMLQSIREDAAWLARMVENLTER